MKQDLVFFILGDIGQYGSRGYTSSRAALKIARLTEVFYISNIFLHEYTGRQNNNQGPL